MVRLNWTRSDKIQNRHSTDQPGSVGTDIWRTSTGVILRFPYSVRLCCDEL